MAAWRNRTGAAFDGDDAESERRLAERRAAPDGLRHRRVAEERDEPDEDEQRRSAPASDPHDEGPEADHEQPDERGEDGVERPRQGARRHTGGVEFEEDGLGGDDPPAGR